METTINFEGETYRLDQRQLYLNLIQQGVLVKTDPKPGQPTTGPVKQPEPDRPATEPIKQPDPVPDPALLTPNSIPPIIMWVGMPVEFRIPDSAFAGPLEHVDVSDLPAGLRYNGEQRTIYGTPSAAGQLTLIVTGVSGSGFARQLARTRLELTVRQPAAAPEPANPEPTVSGGDTCLITGTGTGIYQSKPVQYIIQTNG